ncbi:alpha/beta hydrolase [Methylobacterium isbiliense]|uniref:Hydrolase MhqD n=1 Tax=Methylobacterium isbiliense TaxID=315478 RepID=A0ABQ4SQ19_9HYPH|nr:alpha/beta hydrolase [Methylobacterium isbiliense]MDN3626608.1 alpha/beta hydrolase [Methylobacterium isbiliense]GJE03903.1 Putative hydrolase MhqD [Methylobacterium isbiliense]
MSASEVPDAFHHVVRPAAMPGSPPLVLLHGTGGDETELLPFALTLSPGSAVLAIRGRVSEQGKLRFFPRLADGVFDEDAVLRHAAQLARFITAARELYGLAPPIAVGYSNGANVAAAILQQHEAVFAGAVLLRAVNPLRAEPRASLRGTPILLIAGASDPIAPPGLSEDLAATLRNQGAETSFRTLTCGHALTDEDAESGREWLRA